jgi:putative membrane protein
MHRLTIALPLLAALCCACHSDNHHDDYRAVYTKTVATTPASAARSDMREPHDTFSSDDRKFIEAAMIGGLFEVQSSRTAQLKDISRAALDFAQMMVDDHGRSNRDLDLIARAKGLIPPMHLDARHQIELEDLQRLDGPVFERAYRASQARAHDDAIELFERSAKKVDDAQLSAFIERLLPTLREHRQHLMENISSR